KGQQAENDKTERVTGLGRRTREEIAKWNQMTALRFQTGGGDIRHPRPPFGDQKPWEVVSTLLTVYFSHGKTYRQNSQYTLAMARRIDTTHSIP
ncbi:hypothetical protein, partial [Thiolapillus sp.]|uniref:hypothetical protein n=1 Tax=Thiolapillus sp. TaxID=2017437 RepID=UPI003AF822A7